MILPDNKTDSLLIYCDWLEDNKQLALAIEIRAETNEPIINIWHAKIDTTVVGGDYYSHGVGNLNYNFIGSDLFYPVDNDDDVGTEWFTDNNPGSLLDNLTDDFI